MNKWKIYDWIFSVFIGTFVLEQAGPSFEALGKGQRVAYKVSREKKLVNYVAYYFIFNFYFE
jgi:hypothetical protein